MNKKIGVSADDITGANDIGLMLSKGGCRTAIFPLNQLEGVPCADALDAVVIDTDSRFDPPAVAADKVKKAAWLLRQAGCNVFYKKTCSVFRGNIGAEFDAMQDAIGAKCSMVILGFPANGRTTIQGIHYVYGVALEESQFRKDPIHPMDCSCLKKIMARQTDRRIGNITCDILDQGVAAVKRAVAEGKKSLAYLIFDVRNQADLALIAQAVKEEVSLCGSSALCLELPTVYGQAGEKEAIDRLRHRVEDFCGVMMVAGSLTEQTRRQVEYMRRSGAAVLEFDAGSVFDRQRENQEIARAVEYSAVLVAEGRDVLVHTSNRVEQVTAIKKLGKSLGWTGEQTGRKISAAIFRIADGVLCATGGRKLVVAGGDTSAAVTKGMRIGKMVVMREIEPGVPNMYGITPQKELLLVLKSGSFGSAAFFEKAANSLRLLQAGQ